MFRLMVLFLVVVSGVTIADTELTQEEILEVLKALTDKKAKSWISSGVISAYHEEYRAPKIEDANEVELEVVKAVQYYVKIGSNSKKLEVVPFNTRYRFGNSYNMASREFVKVDGDKYYWQIEVDSRQDLVKPNSVENANYSIEFFSIDSNRLRVFTWDGEKHTRYYRTAKQAIITDDPLNVNGPLTAGCIAWGIGKWSLEEMQQWQLSASRTGSNEILLTFSDDKFVKNIILNELQDYAVKSYERRNKITGIVTSYNYGDYNEFSAGWVPESVLIAEYDNQRQISRDLWADITVVETPLSDDDFIVSYEFDTFVEDFRFGSESLQYHYAPPMELESKKIDMKDVIADKTDYLIQNSGVASNCALASVWYSLKKIGRERHIRELYRKFAIVNGQSSLADMKDLVNSIDGLNAVAVNSDILDIAELKDLQVILYMPGEKHFVNLMAIDDDEVYIADIDSKKFYYKLSLSELEDAWGGMALLISDIHTKHRGKFAKMSISEMATIYGAASCQKCQNGQDASTSGACSYQGNTCSGTIVELFARKVCGGESTSDCPESPRPFKETQQCNFDINDECTSGPPEVTNGTSCG